MKHFESVSGIEIANLKCCKWKTVSPNTGYFSGRSVNKDGYLASIGIFYLFATAA